MAFRITAGLLSVLALTPLLAPPVLAAQEEEGTRVTVFSSPENPAAGSSWVLTLLVRHPAPEEVTVLAPPFTGSFFLDQAVKVPRTVNPGPEQQGTEPAPAELWTAAEYRFMLNSPGTFTLDAFTVITPRGRTETPPLTVQVRRARANAGPVRPRLAWDGIPALLRTGEAAVVNLRVSGWDSRQPVPQPAFFTPPVPEDFILEAAGGDFTDGTLLRLKLIPLGRQPLALPGRTITQGNAAFEIPPLHIPVGPALPQKPDTALMASPGNRDGGPAEAGSLSGGPGPFPDFTFSALPGTLYAGGEHIYNTAKNLWDRGYRAAALAELRRNERNHPAGPFLSALRREAERRLGLTATGDEKWRPRKLLFGGFVVFGLALAACAIRLYLSAPGSRSRKSGPLCIIPLAAAALLCLYGFFDGAGRLPGRSRSAVLKETGVYRVPDSDGMVFARFREGQPALVSPAERKAAGTAGAWVLVRSLDRDGVSGWVPEDRVIFY
jgi:hypothetical protein